MSTTEDRRIEEEVDRTLRAFDDDLPLQGNPFLAGRIKAAMEGWRSTQTWGIGAGARLKYLLLLLILVTNVITAVYFVERSGTDSMHQRLVSVLREDFQIDQSLDSF